MIFTDSNALVLSKLLLPRDRLSATRLSMACSVHAGCLKAMLQGRVG